jgi:hypothetical protein
METITEFHNLVAEYMELHPNSDNPIQYSQLVDVDLLIDALKNAKGREIVYVYDDDETDDGGFIKYVEN